MIFTSVRNVLPLKKIQEEDAPRCSSSRSTGRCCRCPPTDPHCQNRCSGCRTVATHELAAHPLQKNQITKNSFRGTPPRGTAYAAHSPRFPLGERRPAMLQFAVDRATSPWPADRPATPEPQSRRTNSSHSRVATVFGPFI